MSAIFANYPLSLDDRGVLHLHRQPHRAGDRRKDTGSMRWVIAAVAAVVFLGASASAQTNERETVSNGRAWYMYFGDHTLGESPWGFHFDGQLRMEGAFDRRNQLLLRPGINYDVSDNVQFSGGYAFINTNGFVGSPPNFDVPENRLWQQIILRQRIGEVRLTHRYRLEQRFIGKVAESYLGEGEVVGQSYVNRFRYFLKGTVPFARDDRYFAFYNELMVGFGENVQRNIFDQNRAYAAIGFRTGPATSFEIGYLLQTVQRPTGNLVLFNHTFQLGFFSSRPIG